MQSKIENRKSKILIVGAGPSGASLAIRLAQANFRVALIERETFPRRKLCGEFISPECLAHFQELGVLGEMLSAGGERISETVFFEPNGRSVGIPAKWFGDGASDALSLSRAAMDFHLLNKAKALGVDVFEDAQAVGVLMEKDEIRGIKIKCKNAELSEIAADLTIDATGRGGVLSKLVEREANSKLKKIEIQRADTAVKIRNPKSKNQHRLVGFKTHLQTVNLEKNVCEIYFFPGGYGGLSYVENNLANHCFLIKSEIVKQFNSDAERIVREVIFQNKRAAQTMENAVPVHDWLAVSVDGFGQKELNPAKNLIAVGDAGAFIDPFTGSGMLMAFESAKILAQVVTGNNFEPETIAENYKLAHRRKFQKRLRVCSLLRRAAFVPNLAAVAIKILSLNRKARFGLTRSTRAEISDFVGK